MGEGKGEVRSGLGVGKEGTLDYIEATVLVDAKQVQQPSQPKLQQQQQPQQQQQQPPQPHQQQPQPFLMDHRPSLLRLDEFRDEYVTDDFYMFGE